MVRELDARWYATFHHVGVLEGRDAFVERLDRFAAVIARREAALLEFLAEPRSLDEIAAHRFVYRPGDVVAYAEVVERRSMGQHVARLLAAGRSRKPSRACFAARGLKAPAAGGASPTLPARRRGVPHGATLSRRARRSSRAGEAARRVDVTRRSHGAGTLSPEALKEARSTGSARGLDRDMYKDSYSNGAMEDQSHRVLPHGRWI